MARLRLQSTFTVTINAGATRTIFRATAPTNQRLAITGSVKASAVDATLAQSLIIAKEQQTDGTGTTITPIPTNPKDTEAPTGVYKKDFSAEPAADASGRVLDTQYFQPLYGYRFGEMVVNGGKSVGFVLNNPSGSNVTYAVNIYVEE